MSEGLNEQKGGGDSIISDLCSITWLQTNANCRDSSVNKQALATGCTISVHTLIFIVFETLNRRTKTPTFHEHEQEKEKTQMAL